MKIVFTGGGTGGHFYPIIAVAEAIGKAAQEKQLLAPRMYYIAPTPFDEQALFANNIEYIKSPAGKMRRYASILNFFDLFKTFGGVVWSLFTLFRMYPDVVFSKGGYASVPTVIAAHILRIPIIIHESDAKPGRANIFASKYAYRIAVAFDSVAQYLPEKTRIKIARTGIPIRREIARPLTEGASELLGLDPTVPTVLVIGGSLGSQKINETLLGAISDTLTVANVIHQTGKDNFAEVSGESSVILEKDVHKSRYHVYPYLSAEALREAAGACSLVVSRAGATSIAEISLWQRPAILIPIPESVSHDQRTNAYAYANTGGAVVLEEANMTPHVLSSEIRRIISDPALSKEMAQKGSTFGSMDAAQIIAEELLAIGLPMSLPYNNDMNVRTRFAPSPTGFMHIGGVRTALFAWIFARQNGGQFILRIEDTDKEREVEGSIGHIMESLKWLGIEWDEGPDVGGPYEPYVQSSRLDLYREYAQKLISSGFAYPDPYTTKEVDAFRTEADAAKKPFLFREHRPEHADEWMARSRLRFRVPELKRYEWHDIVYGDLSAGEEALDDFVLIKSDGYPTYNFCHVVDDIEMKVTHVMRGQEFIASTPKFLSLYDALELPPPQFATLPPILGEGGNKKLGKRDGAKDILEYRTEGYLPEAMVNFLALIGWNPGTEQEMFSTAELVSQFSLERVQHSGGQFDEEKLLFINQQWMRTLSAERYIEKGELTSTNPEILLKSVPLLKERARTFEEARVMLSGELSCLFTAPDLTDSGSRAMMRKNEPDTASGLTIEALQHLSGLIEAIPASFPASASTDEIKALLMPYADQNSKEMGGRGAILWPLRYALSGQERSPDPFTLIHILGAHESVLRISKAIAILG